MSIMLRKLLSRVYRNEEDGSGMSEGAPAEGSDESGSDDSVDWADMNDGVDPGADDEDEGGDTKSPASSAKPAAKQQPPADDATPNEGEEEPDPENPEETPETPPEDEVPPKQPTPEELTAQQEKLANDFKEWQASELERLATKVYAFDEETAQRLQTEPELVLPKLAAQLELNATQRALEAVQRLLPQLVPQLTAAQQTEQQANEFFFKHNPDLRKYKQQVLEAGQMFRKMNKNATPEEAVKRIGNMVRTSLGLEVVATAAPAKAAPAKRTAPHKPANAGSGRTAPVKSAPEKDIWNDLASDDD